MNPSSPSKPEFRNIRIVLTDGTTREVDETEARAAVALDSDAVVFTCTMKRRKAIGGSLVPCGHTAVAKDMKNVDPDLVDGRRTKPVCPVCEEQILQPRGLKTYNLRGTIMYLLGKHDERMKEYEAVEAARKERERLAAAAVAELEDAFADFTADMVEEARKATIIEKPRPRHGHTIGDFVRSQGRDDDRRDGKKGFRSGKGRERDEVRRQLHGHPEE